MTRYWFTSSSICTNKVRLFGFLWRVTCGGIIAPKPHSTVRACRSCGKEYPFPPNNPYRKSASAMI